MRILHVGKRILIKMLVWLTLFSLAPYQVFWPARPALADPPGPLPLSTRVQVASPSHPIIAAAALPLTRITAAGYYTPTRELIIVGQSDGSWPGVDRAYIHENLLLTLRAAYNNPLEWPGVTIEFAPLPGKPPVPPGYLPVYNFGQTDNTHHGQVTFESDRLLKTYSLGKDNLTGQVVTSTVPCYKSVLNKLVELQQQNYQPGPVNPQRFYFEPDMKLDVTPISTSVTITQSRMVLKWAYIPPNTPNRTQNATDAAQYFVDCFNNNYNAFAAEQAAKGNATLYELRILGEIAAVAKWIQDYQLDSVNEALDGIHYPWLNAYANATVVPTTTITATPAITVSSSFVVTPTVITQSIYGGVDMSPPNAYSTNANAGQIVLAALQARFSQSVLEWLAPGAVCLTSSLSTDDVVPLDCTPKAQSQRMSMELLEDNNLDEMPPAQWIENSPFEIVANGEATMAGYNNAVESLKQQGMLPTEVITSGLAAAASNPLIVLTFDWAVGPVDPNSSSVDLLYLRLRKANSDLIGTVYTITNKSTPVGIWQTASVDVSSLLQPYLGQTIELSFEDQTDSSGVTTFYVDNVFLDTNLFPSGCGTPLEGVTITGPTSGLTNQMYMFTASPNPVGATAPITYTWSPAPNSGQGTASAGYSWSTVGDKAISVTVENCGAIVLDNHLVTVNNLYGLYLPLVLNKSSGGAGGAAPQSGRRTLSPLSLRASPLAVYSPADPGSVLRYQLEER